MRFIVSRQPPGVPTLLAPVNNATGVSRTPTLTWQAAAQAATDTVEVARNPSFTQLVYTTVVPTTSATVDVPLDSGTTFYWRVTAGNACGTGLGAAAFRLTTVAQRDYFTQQFTGRGNNFDLAYNSLPLIPDGSGNYYRMCGSEATALPIDPAGGTTVPLGDAGSLGHVRRHPHLLPRRPDERLRHCRRQPDLHGRRRDVAGNTRRPLRVAPDLRLARRLNPAAGATVSYQRLPDRFVATRLNVPE